MGNFIENTDMLEILPPSSIITNSLGTIPAADIAFPTEAIFKGDTSQLILHREPGALCKRRTAMY